MYTHPELSSNFQTKNATFKILASNSIRNINFIDMWKNHNRFQAVQINYKGINNLTGKFVDRDAACLYV